MDKKIYALPEGVITRVDECDQNTSSEEYRTEYDQIIMDLEQELDGLRCNADTVDYLVAAASGVLSGALDILWTGGFDLREGREVSSQKIEQFVMFAAKRQGYDKPDITIHDAVVYLEQHFPLAADGVTADFGGGLQHHLRDFSHHPTIVGLFFSILTQFTEQVYGTDTAGNFIIVPVPETHRQFIGQDPADKFLKGSIIWFFHLVSDMAGSAATAGLSGGTGIPGPLLSLAKELSAIPVFHQIKIGEYDITLFLSKLFNGTLLASHDENGKIIKESKLQFDLRGEMGVWHQIGKQAVPVIANEVIVRVFYFVRRLSQQVKSVNIKKLEDFRKIAWKDVSPANNATISRMLAVASGVFCAVDVTEAVATKKYFVNVNYVGVSRFAFAIKSECAIWLKARDLERIKEEYQKLREAEFRKCGQTGIERLKIDAEQLEILYNLEYYKARIDVLRTKQPELYNLKSKWLVEWKSKITEGFPAFVGDPDEKMHWYSKAKLVEKVEEQMPNCTWFRLVLLEAMIFDPYYPLSTETDKKGNEIPSTEYKKIYHTRNGYNHKDGDAYLDKFFREKYYSKGYVLQLRKEYNSALNDLNEKVKSGLKSALITTTVAVATVASAGLFAPEIAVLLVGSKFAGLSGAALYSASLAYLGGGAIAAGGAGMAGGTAAIVGGGALLGTGAGAGVSGLLSENRTQNKEFVIQHSAKLMVTVKTILLGDERDTLNARSILHDFIDRKQKLEKDLSGIEIELKTSSGDYKKNRKQQKDALEEEIHILEIAQKRLGKEIIACEKKRIK